MKRSSQREQIFKILFRAEFNDLSEMPRQEEFYFESGDMDFTERDRYYISNKVNRILGKCPEIDGVLSEKMKGWTLDRIGRVELAILRLGVYEILYDEDIPTSVAISEAVELAKKFGDENSGVFVNGVLASVAREADTAPVKENPGPSASEGEAAPAAASPGKIG